MNMTKLNQLHLANELAIHNFKHQNFKDTQTLNFGQAKNENKNKHNHYYGRQPHNLDKKSHAKKSCNNLHAYKILTLCSA